MDYSKKRIGYFVYSSNKIPETVSTPFSPFRTFVSLQDLFRPSPPRCEPCREDSFRPSDVLKSPLVRPRSQSQVGPLVLTIVYIYVYIPKPKNVEFFTQFTRDIPTIGTQTHSDLELQVLRPSVRIFCLPLISSGSRPSWDVRTRFGCVCLTLGTVQNNGDWNYHTGKTDTFGPRK